VGRGADDLHVEEQRVALLAYVDPREVKERLPGDLTASAVDATTSATRETTSTTNGFGACIDPG
jgi:hypothetical protein